MAGGTTEAWPGVELRQKLDLLPDQPGVYVFSGPGGEIIYVGKARSLRQRVRSYFQPARDLDSRKEAMVGQVRDLEYIATGSPVEALILEANLIKKHHPRYNVLLRDDKQYPYVRIGLDEQYPSVTVVRARKKDGARYFGPYTQARAMRDTLQMLRRVFPYHSCRRVEDRKRPCLNGFIGRCLGPCLGHVTETQYREVIDGLLLALEGRSDDVFELLERRMRDAAGAMDFERAARCRDQLRAMQAMVERREVVTTGFLDLDVIAVAADPVTACAQVFFFRRGKLVGRDAYFLRGAERGAEAEALGAFISHFYAVAAEIPPQILLSAAVEDQEVVEAWLSGLRGKRVHVRTPRRGEGLRLVRMAAANAALSLEERRKRREADEAAMESDLLDLAAALGLDEYPQRVECFDVSNISGQDAVASMVVFEGGRPKKDDYRHFRVRTGGPDDYAMMQEVLARRLRRVRTAGGETASDSFALLPDLIIVDGGRGQANAAATALRQEGLERIALFGLAKEREVLYPPGDAAPVVLPTGSGALFMVMRLRDEAHRFAVSYHRKVRAQRALKSVLDDIPGVGPSRRTLLLRHFGSGRAVAAASLEQLKELPGLPEPVARKVYERFHPSPEVEQKEGSGRDDAPEGPKG